MRRFFSSGGCTVPEGGIARIRPHRAGDPEAGHRGGAHGARRGRRGRRPRLRQSRGSARDAVLLRARQRHRRSRPRVGRACAGSRRAGRRAAARPARPAAARRGCARRDGACGGRVLPAAHLRARGRRCHGDEREDDHGVPALLDAGRRRMAAGIARYGREPRRGRAAAVCSTRRRRRSTFSAPSGRCSTRAIGAARSRRPRMRPRSTGSTSFASVRWCSRT